MIGNSGGAVTTAVLLLVIPPTLLAVISGAGTEVGRWAAVIATVTWALVPAAAELLVAIQRRSVL